MTTPYVYVMPNRSPYQQPSPFLPPANVLPGSPYASPYSSPYRTNTQLPTGSPNNVHVPLPAGAVNTPVHEYNPYGQFHGNQPGWGRPRRQSFSDDEYVPSWLPNPQARGRRNSFNGGAVTGYPPYPQTTGYWPPPGNPYPSNYINSGFNLHPLLNGDSPQIPIIFDLSTPKFAPLRYIGPGQTAWLTDKELQEPATWPGLNQLRIECDLVPQWPIIFEVDPTYFGGQSPPIGTPIPPITLSDVLVKIFDHFSQRITHMDWAQLSPQDESNIAKAYTRRCKALGTAEAIERSHGVKRIDYCLGKVWFRGLTRSGDGMNVLKLHLQKKSV